ncbi:hypothetical protein OTERR_22690 [Oryzomicrobium terrae]|uniref:Nudix hydrolase domain-containing protein n=1 Tax=Oryzomicrobium terrae TaxID=1735038 RepID=A0A5C1EAN2_9RHOO|nr:NUDIX domain-containing protein [Oryzomicrobium terrae]QEL65745.1 hypothetical protein OTERR_22690 [Oryzomicrobium terrae]
MSEFTPHTSPSLAALDPLHRYCPRCRAPLTTDEIGGHERALCTACDYVFWGNPVPVVAALVEWQGQMILARNQAWAEGKFGLITGFLERDEAPDEAVRREVGEELSLVATSADLIGLYPFPRKNELLIVYHVRAEGEIVLNEELAEIRLVPPARLQAWDYGTGLAVADWLRRAGLGAQAG